MVQFLLFEIYIFFIQVTIIVGPHPLSFASPKGSIIEDFMMLLFHPVVDKLERNKLLDSGFEEAFIEWVSEVDEM